MNVTKLNKEKSIELYKKYKKHIEKKMCYNNTFNIVLFDDNICTKVSTGEWKVAYCYFKILDNDIFFARHCCFYDTKNDEVVDVTAPIISDFNKRKEHEYYIFKTYNHSEYIDALYKDDRNPGLNDVLFKESCEAENKLFEMGYVGLS